MPVAFGYDSLSNSVLMTCQVEAAGCQLVPALGEIGKLLKRHPSSRLLLDLKHLVDCDALTLRFIRQEWLPSISKHGTEVIALIPSQHQRAGAAIDQLMATAGQMGIEVFTFSSTEEAHQWLVAH